MVLRPFHLGWQSTNATPWRAEKLVEDIVGLTEADAHREYTHVLKDFGERHWQTEQVFDASMLRWKPPCTSTESITRANANA